MQRLHPGHVLTRRDIAALFGGNARAFLPRLPGGEVVAGCFDPAMNPRAPHEVLVHNSPNALLAAQRLLTQSRAENPLLEEECQPLWADGVVATSAQTKKSAPIPNPKSEFPNLHVPVFLRRAPNVWEYIGRYRAVAYSNDPTEVARRIYEIHPRIYEKYAREYGEMKGILFLEEE